MKHLLGVHAVAVLSLIFSGCGGGDDASVSNAGPAGVGGGAGTSVGGSHAAGGSSGSSNAGGASGSAGVAGSGGHGASSAGGQAGHGAAGGSGQGGGTAGGAGASAHGGAAQGAGGASQGTGGSAAGGASTGAGGKGPGAGGAATGGSGGAMAGGGGGAQGGASTGVGGAGVGGGSMCCSAGSCDFGSECVASVCKVVPPPSVCWIDSDCQALPGGPYVCEGAFVCQCGAACSPPDAEGKCVAQGGAGGVGGAGGGSACCTDDFSCGDVVPQECVKGVCKPPEPSGQCWRDADCGPGGACVGAFVCPCPQACNNLDSPGTCASGVGGAGGTGGNGCCGGNGDCKPGEECVNAVCKPHPGGGLCWSQNDCNFPGPGVYLCENASVCACGDTCTPLDHEGKCVLQADPCPAKVPIAGSPCAVSPLDSCEYGSDPRPTCRFQALCLGSQWTVATPACASLPQPGAMGCPKDPASADGTACATPDELCDEGGGWVCGCNVCGPHPCGPPTGKSVWTCSPPPNSPCPATPPDVGQPCTTDPTLQCGYGICTTDTHAGRSCQNGAWVSDEPTCPP